MTWMIKNTVRAGLLVVLAVALALGLPQAGLAADDAGTIDFMSPGGTMAGLYTLNVSVTWCGEAGTVCYGVDASAVCNPMAPTSGTYYEAVIDTQTLGDGAHTIHVEAENLDCNITTVQQEIVVDNTPPAVTVDDPGPGPVTGDLTVTAHVEDAHLDYTSVVAILDGNMGDTRRMTGSAGTFTYVVDTVSEWTNGMHNVSVMASDTLGHVTHSENLTVQVDNEPPDVAITSMGGHAKGFYTLTAYISDPNIDADAIWAVFDGDELNRKKMDAKGDGVFSYKFDTTNMADGDHLVYVLATDLADQTRRSDDLLLKVDNNPPACAITSQGGNASGYYTFTATVTDVYLNSSWVYLVVDGDDANATELVWAGDRFETVIDTRDLADGVRNLTVWAADLWGQTSRSAPVPIDVDNNMPYVMITSGGGTKWGKYQVKAAISDPHLDRSCVMVKVGSAAQAPMRFSNDQWYYDIDTTKLSDGPLSIQVIACDTRGNRNDGETVDIVVSNRPDLEITAVQWTKTTVAPGSMAQVKVTVRNNGHTTANNFEVAMMSGTSVLTSAKELTGILPGKSHTFTLEWKASGSGDKQVRLVVDAGDALEEADETNNHWDPQTITVDEESPGMGAALAVLAVAGAAALVGRRRLEGT